MESYEKLSNYYDEIILKDIDYKNIKEFILRKTENKNYYLDLGCGTANLSSLIGEYFKETYLIDISENMLALASNKFYDKNIKFKAFNISMTDINLLGEKFSLVSSTIDSLNYIQKAKEIKEVFTHVYNLLEDNGVFIFDLNSKYKLENILGNNTFIYDEDDIFYTWENFLDETTIDMYLNFFIKRDDTYKRFTEVHTEKIYETEFIRNTLKDVRFTEIEIYDNYKEKEINNKSERITFVVRK